MDYVEHFVRVGSSDPGFAAPEAIATTVRQVPVAARAVASMALEGRGQHTGRPAKWQSLVGDLKFGSALPDDTGMMIRFFAPRIGDAAFDLYEQSDLFWRRPDPDWTALDLLESAVAAIDDLDRESDLYDQYVLRQIEKFRPALLQGNEIAFCGRRLPDSDPVSLSIGTLERIGHLRSETPSPQEVRLLGQLDMIRASTRGFSLKLDEGIDVPGVYSGEIDDLLALFRRRVLVQGTLVYRPSGSILRLDATEMKPGEGEGHLWSRLPGSESLALLPGGLLRSQGSRSGVGAFLGEWPGTEDDETVAQELARLS